MRLLSKRETEHALSEEQRKRIDDGLKIARKVDAMREQLATTETKYNDFRTNSLSVIVKEIEEKRKESSQLDDKIAIRKTELEALFEPLDKQFAIYVRTERGRIEQEQARLKSESENLTRDALSQEEKEARLKDVSNTLKAERIENQRIRNEASSVLASAKNQELQTKTRCLSLEKESEALRNDALKLREQASLVMQKAKLKEDSLNDKENALDDRELKIVLEELKNYTPDKPLVRFDRLSKRKK